MSIPIYIVGGGGHSLVVVDALRSMGNEVAGVVDPLGQDAPIVKSGIPVIADDDELLKFEPENISLAIGIGGTGETRLRRRCFEMFDEKGYHFVQVIHPSVTVSTHAEFGDGVQLMAGSVIQPGCVIGKNSIINTRASIDHECQIGDHVHIAPGVILSGNVTVGDRSHIGVGAVILQGIEIGPGSVVGAGAVVLSDIPSGVCAWGAPATVAGESFN